MICPIAGCEVEINSSLVMCRKHWYQVPKDLRQEVWSAWRRRTAAAEADDAFYQEAADRHEHAKIVAIASVRP